ncbi:pentapeptide repeat-containing protein, partial [Plasticicumulans sp.]|uniref:pentapeptide repeat-containing protein n=1 Tax=Plasticicumulans sp. TaxID=2307179 RepID=UPI002C4626A6
MPAKPLHPDVVRRNADKVAEQMGRADQERFERLLGLPVAGDRRFSLAAVLGALFEGMAREAALTALRQFRQRLKAAADEAGVQLALEADGQTRAAPENRWCWFEGEDGRVAAAAGFTRAEVEAGARLRMPQSAVEFTERDADGRLVVPYFVSYAHGDDKLVSDLLERLRIRFKSAKEYRFEQWQDKDIVIGSHWRDEIQSAIARCKVGLLLVSPAFLASTFITEQELPQFVAAKADCPEPLKPALPVELKPLDFSGASDLKGLEEIQVFRHNGKSFQARTTDKVKDEFADALYQAILKALKVHLPPSPPPEPSPRRWDEHLRRHLDYKPEAFVPTQGSCIDMEKFQPDASARGPAPERTDALEYLENWLSNPNAQPYCALLGEYGMGKTTTCKALAAHLLDLREQDPSLPLPIYFDLRLVGDLAKEQPVLERIVEITLARSWLGDATRMGSRLNAKEAIRLVCEEGALAIFDGLDEVLVHLPDAAGRRFARELFRILPPAVARKADEKKRPGRLLLSCRSHYFRTLRDEKTFLTAEGRDGIAADDYRALVLLPFTEEQIREYLQHTLPDDDPERVLDLIRSVHNLSEIAERPYTLSLITQHIPKIERWKLEGRRVSGVMLYREMVLEWLERDAGKHHLTPEHKCELMEQFAAELWRTGDKSWSVAQLEQWLIDYLRKRPEIDAHYTTKDRGLLKEDLRTATFLVREGEDRFRFAHTSLQEYFLACHLQRALLDDQPDAWALPALNRETLDFLGQLLREAGLAQVQIGLRNLRDTYRPQASENALTYALLAMGKGYPHVPLTGVRLEGANLRGLELLGDPDKPKLNLRSAVLRGARIDNSRFHWLDLDNADFAGADLSYTEWQQVRADAVRLVGTKLTGAVFRDCSLEKADASDAQCYRTQWLHCR